MFLSVEFTDMAVAVYFYFHFSLCMFPFIILLVHFLDMQLIAQAGIGHQMTSLMVKEASDWFDRFFKK